MMIFLVCLQALCFSIAFRTQQCSCCCCCCCFCIQTAQNGAPKNKLQLARGLIWNKDKLWNKHICYSYETRSQLENISWIGLHCSCICKYIGHFWWKEEGCRWATATTTTTMATNMDFTEVLVINHKSYDTFASRMLLLVGLYFQNIEIGCLCVETHLHDP